MDRKLKAVSGVLLGLLLALVADSVSKLWAEQTLRLHRPVPILGDMFRLTLSYNTGVAFGLFANGGIWPLVLMGIDRRDAPFLVDMLPYGGRGGMPGLDGMLPVAYPTNSTITPCEVMETRAPVLFLRKALRPDSGGPGRRRGGLGQIIAFRHAGPHPITFNLTPDRITTLPQGLDGGAPGRPGEVFINGERITRFPPIRLHPGDVVELHLPGGGGFGPVGGRERERVLHDVAMGYVTVRGAQDDYALGVEDLPPPLRDVVLARETGQPGGSRQSGEEE